MKLYFHYLSINLRGIMQYKASFLLTAIGQFFVSFNVFLGIMFMFQRFSKVEGFTYHEVILCYGIFLMQYTIAETIFRGFSTFEHMIQRGEFDRILVRPKNVMLQILGSRFEFNRLGPFLQAIVMFVYGIQSNQIEWTFFKVLTLICMLIGGFALFSSIFIFYGGICFYTVKNLEFFNVFTYGAKEYGKYPVGVYGKGMLKFCTYMIPYALIQYYPLLYLLDIKTDWYYSLIPLLAGWTLIPSMILWNVGVHKYQSTGS